MSQDEKTSHPAAQASGASPSASAVKEQHTDEQRPADEVRRPDERLLAAEALIASGNNAAARRKLKALLADSGAADTDRQRARELLATINVDKVAVYIGLAVLALFLIVFYLGVIARHS